jgi:hypothetical protein
MNKPIIDFKVKKNGKAKICIDGDVKELYAAVLVLIKSLHHNILLNIDEAEAEHFLQQIGKAMVDPDYPLYKEVRE